MNFKLTCSDGYTKTLTAASKDEAVKAFLADAEVQAHVAQVHPELAGKAPEEVAAMVAGMVTEEAAPVAGEAPAGGDATGGAPTDGAPTGGTV